MLIDSAFRDNTVNFDWSSDGGAIFATRGATLRAERTTFECDFAAMGICLAVMRSS